MKSKDDVELLEKTIGQLSSIHSEISLLSKKSPNDAVNSFKLKMINSVIDVSNGVFGDAYRPLEKFERFEDDDAPSTSDVVFVISLYLVEIKRFQKDHAVYDEKKFQWVYLLDGKPSGILAPKIAKGVRG